jgi:hypothetical protein
MLVLAIGVTLGAGGDSKHHWLSPNGFSHYLRILPPFEPARMVQFIRVADSGQEKSAADQLVMSSLNNRAPASCVALHRSVPDLQLPLSGT